jgi:hypothetical protein
MIFTKHLTFFGQPREDLNQEPDPQGQSRIILVSHEGACALCSTLHDCAAPTHLRGFPTPRAAKQAAISFPF